LLVEYNNGDFTNTANLEIFKQDSRSIKFLKETRPDLLISFFQGQFSPNLEDSFQSLVEYPLKVFYPPVYSLETIYAAYEDLGTQIGSATEGRNYSQRIKAQYMNWADNFYDRTKNKKVVFLSSISPLKIAGLWISDMIKLISCIPMNNSGDTDSVTSWDDIVAFRPDVMVFAPKNSDIDESSKIFLELEKQSFWEKIPAVKRGEVIFTNGIDHFYNPCFNLIESMGILVSSVAGFDAGYITPKESFHRLRWLELNRHKLKK